MCGGVGYRGGRSVQIHSPLRTRRSECTGVNFKPFRSLTGLFKVHKIYTAPRSSAPAFCHSASVHMPNSDPVSDAVGLVPRPFYRRASRRTPRDPDYHAPCAKHCAFAKRFSLAGHRHLVIVSLSANDESVFYRFV